LALLELLKLLPLLILLPLLRRRLGRLLRLLRRWWQYKRRIWHWLGGEFDVCLRQDSLELKI
jgi:hypothetical protein